MLVAAKVRSASAQLAESPLVVGTLLSTLDIPHHGPVLVLWVPVVAIILVRTLIIFPPVLTNWHLFLIVRVKEIALFAPSALIFVPMHTNHLLPLRVLHTVVYSVVDGLELVNRHGLRLIEVSWRALCHF